ncbi:MAG: ATP-binding cassette domain-containing protein [Eubacteriales bacterium]|nr:ATP-binding cassette domain-containing protein [Eubacteriales bacterium]
MYLLETNELKVHFPMKNDKKVVIKAVDGVSFQIPEGKTFGLVGESGCGKSTTARAIIRLYQPTGGDILFDGKNTANLKGKDLKEYRRNVQMVFQDPYASLNPRMTVNQTIMDPMKIYKAGTNEEMQRRVYELMELVGLDQRFAKRFPHEFSGGQRQRIGIARALALNPKLVILDEPVSALDVSVQSQILNLLKNLQDELKLTYLFISHNLSVVDYMCENIAVMYLGRIVEQASREELFQNPKHPYTQALLSAIPSIDHQLTGDEKFLTGDIPSPANPPSGCTFHTRCPYACERCRKEVPGKTQISETHTAFCHMIQK